MIYIAGDTHGHIELNKLSSKNWPDGKNLSKSDYLIVCGDFGLIWENEPDNCEKYWIDWLNKKSFTTLFVDGNHENHPRLNLLERVDFFGGIAGKISSSIYHLRRGQIYTIDGKKIFTFGGAVSTDKHTRKIGIEWWPEEVANFEEMNFAIDNLEKNSNNVDYIVSHTGPLSFFKNIDCDPWVDDPTTKFLDHIVSTVNFKKLYCGHLHVDRQFKKCRVLYDDIVLLD